MRIINRLPELRAHAGKTQEQVIDEMTALLGYRPFTRQALSHWETGRNPLSPEELALLCSYYRCGPGDILALEGESPLAMAHA